MYNNFWGNYGGGYMPGYIATMMSAFLIPISLWSLFWMGWALWKAAKADSKPWFIALLLIHTMGILDILYIFVFSKAKKGKKRK